MPNRLHPELRGVLSQFALWLANGTLGHPVLDGVDYAETLREPTAMETVLGIFANALELDADGAPLNARHAETRAAQWLRGYCDPAYVVEPPITDAEMELHSPGSMKNAPAWTPSAR